MGVISKSKAADFNIFQNSPVIEYYLKSYGSGGDQKKISIRRNEVIKNIIPESHVTYRQLVMESARSSKSRSNQFKLAQDEIIRERNRISQESALVLALDHEKAVKILRKQQSIKLTADYIIEAHSNLRKGTRVGNLPFLKS